MTDRIKKLCAYLGVCSTFADVGCDHGYCTLYMLESGLCNNAVISDISAPSLAKAERLLKDYTAAGRVKAVCCAGLEKVPECDLVLIAGMGGEEICSILENAYIPRSFVFQPMKNAKKLREYLLLNGACISVDEPFESGGKFYFVIKGGADEKFLSYTQAELQFGKNLGGATTKKYILSELEKKRSYLERGLSDKERQRIEQEIRFSEGVLNGEIK